MRDPKWPIGKATDTPDTDEAEVEGHGIRRFGPAEQVTQQPADDPEAENEVAGHALRGKAVEQPGDDPEAEAEVAGHGYRHGVTEQSTDAEQDLEAEVEGHGRKPGVTEQPTDENTDPDAGDTESMIRRG
jgi:hypothetical protein